MRKALIVVVLVAAACSTVADSVRDNISIDVEGIIASTCEAFAQQLADQIETQLADVTGDSDLPVPDIDIQGAIDRASSLGCSPDDMRSLIEEKLDTVNATSDQARDLIDQLKEETAAP